MSGTGTPNLDLQYLDPSQSQPEIKVNDAWNKIDAAVGEGSGIAVSDLSSPPIVARAIELKFMGATVTHETGGVARIEIDNSSDTSSDSGGSPLTVTDGTNSVTDVVEIHFTNAAVSDAGSGVANVHADTTSGGGGGGNLTPDSHPDSPDALDDEGEGTIGTLDGSWTWYNQGGATAVYDGQGAIKLTAPAASGVNCRFIGKPISGAAWRVRAPVIIGMTATAHNAGLLAYESGTGKVMRMTVYDNSGTPTYQITALTSLSGSGAFTTSGALTGFPILLNALQKIYMELELASGVLHGRFSTSGYDGTFVELGTVNVADAFTTAADTIGAFIESQNASIPNSAWIDWFRRMA